MPKLNVQTEDDAPEAKPLHRPVTPPVTQKQALQLWRERKDNLAIPTGIDDFDRVLGGGLPVRQVTTVLGYTGSHKSEFARQIRSKVSAAKYNVIHVDVELGADRIVERDLAQLSGLAPGRIRNGHLTKEEYNRFEEAQAKIEANDNIYTYCPRSFETTVDLLGEIDKHVQALQKENTKPILCIFDSAQRLAIGMPGDNQRLQVQNLLWALETFARRNLVAVLLVSEQARAREGGSPNPDDLLASGAESRAIEFVSDVLFGLVPVSKTTATVAADATATWEREVGVLIGKNRNGSLGYLKVDLVFKAPTWDMAIVPRKPQEDNKKRGKKQPQRLEPGVGYTFAQLAEIWQIDVANVKEVVKAALDNGSLMTLGDDEATGQPLYGQWLGGKKR